MIYNGGLSNRKWGWDNCHWINWNNMFSKLYWCLDKRVTQWYILRGIMATNLAEDFHWTKDLVCSNDAKLSMLQCWLNSQTNRRRRSDTSLPNDKNILKNSQLHYKSTICQPSQLVRFTRVKHNQKPNKTSSNRVQRQYWRKKARNRNRNS